MSTDLREATTCCHALQDKVWVDDPDQVPWEIYTVLADVDQSSDEGAPVPLAKAAQPAPLGIPATHCC